MNYTLELRVIDPIRIFVYNCKYVTIIIIIIISLLRINSLYDKFIGYSLRASHCSHMFVNGDS